MKLTEVAAAVIERPDGSFLLGQRAPDTFYPGYWEFPGASACGSIGGPSAGLQPA